MPNICGLNAECHVVSHSAICECVPEFYGDPFVQCSRRENIIQLQEAYNPCDPSPCGPNAMCREQNYVGVCQCIDQYQGNPYDGCRPECVLNSDCATSKACVRNRCEDPCAGTCGPHAICQVVNHLPACTCEYGYTGDSYRYCALIQHERESNESFRRRFDTTPTRNLTVSSSFFTLSSTMAAPFRVDSNRSPANEPMPSVSVRPEQPVP